MALDALEEVAALCHRQEVRRTRVLAVVLAFLASRGGDRQPFDQFWRGVGIAREQERWAYVNSALNGVYGVVGFQRDMGVVSRYAKIARNQFADDRKDVIVVRDKREECAWRKFLIAGE